MIGCLFSMKRLASAVNVGGLAKHIPLLALCVMLAAFQFCSNAYAQADQPPPDVMEGIAGDDDSLANALIGELADQDEDADGTNALTGIKPIGRVLGF